MAHDILYILGDETYETIHTQLSFSEYYQGLPPPGTLLENIYISETFDLTESMLSTYTYGETILIFNDSRNILSELSIRVYFKTDLGYTCDTNTEAQIYIYTLERPSIKIVYFCSIQNKYTDAVAQSIEQYCSLKKYSVGLFMDESYINVATRLNVILDELLTCKYMLILFNYSFIINWETNLTRYLNTHSVHNFPLYIDSSNDSGLENFLCINMDDTRCILEDIMTVHSLGTLHEYVNKWEGIHLKISPNTFNTTKLLESQPSTRDYIITLNNVNDSTSSLPLFSILFNYYINIHEDTYHDINSFHYKEYAWGFLKKGALDRISLRGPSKVDSTLGNGFYKKITKVSFILSAGTYTIFIMFNRDFSRFRGYNLATYEELAGYQIL